MSSRKRRTQVKRPISGLNPYYWILCLSTVIVLFGLIIIISSSQIIAYSKYKDVLFFFKRQALYAICGALLFWMVSRLDYRRLSDLSWPIAIACTIMLLVLFIPSIGHRAGGSSRWIPLGFINLQPSEIAKLSAILLTVHILDIKENNDIASYMPMLMIAGMAVLVLAQPDMGTTILIVLSVVLILFIDGLEYSYMGAIFAAGSVAAMALIIIEPYRFKRLMSFINPYKYAKEGGYQIIQSLIALGSGGVSGVGLAMSKQKFFFLPAAHTDFILAIIGEELGILGTIGVVLAFMLLAIVGFSVANNARDNYGRLLAVGLTVMIIFQAMINMGAAVGLMPITGIPLPLISFGGSSLLVTMTSLGILASIALDSNRRTKGT